MTKNNDTPFCPECGDELFPDQEVCTCCGMVVHHKEFTAMVLVEKNETYKKPLSHLQCRRQVIEATLINILSLLHWDEMKYCYFKYKAGLDYIFLLSKGDTDVFAMLEQSRTFWNWWRNHWQLRDEAFASSCIDIIRTANRRRVYVSMHDPEKIFKDVYPNYAVFEDCYAEMVSKSNKELTQQRIKS